MPLSPEKFDPRNLDRKKQILLAAAAIALGTAAYNRSKVNGKKVYSVLFVKGIQTIYADIVDNGKGLSERITGKVVFGEDDEIADVTPDEDRPEPTEGMYNEYETAFFQTDWSEPGENSLQTG